MNLVDQIEAKESEFLAQASSLMPVLPFELPDPHQP